MSRGHTDGFPHVTDIIKAAGLMGETWYYTDEARDRGTAVHLCTQFMDEGALDPSTIDPSIDKLVAGYAKFIEEVNPKILEIEKHYVQRTLHYQGTADRIVQINGKAVIDIKAGTPEPWHQIQTAAYAQMANVMGRYCLYLKPNGYKLVPHRERGDWGVFQSALNC